MQDEVARDLAAAKRWAANNTQADLSFPDHGGSSRTGFGGALTLARDSFARVG